MTSELSALFPDTGYRKPGTFRETLGGLRRIIGVR